MTTEYKLACTGATFSYTGAWNHWTAASGSIKSNSAGDASLAASTKYVAIGEKFIVTHAAVAADTACNLSSAITATAMVIG